MRPIETPRLVLRNWEERDRDLFHRINSDEEVMAFFPFRRSRAESNEFMDRLRARNRDMGFGFAAIEIGETGETAGFAGIADETPVPGAAASELEIGWRLAPEHWGKGYATEAATAWLDHAFATLARPHVWSFAVEANARSTAVMRRLGMKAAPERDFDHPRVPDTHPHLRRHVVFVIDARGWRRQQEIASAS